MSDAAAAKKPTKIESEALALFSVASPDKIPAVLWALGLREKCSRCLGSGHYSRNAMGSTTCYRCNGRRESAAKLTRAVLEQARVKVAAGELDAARARAVAKRAAKAAVAPRAEEGRAAYAEISDAYEVAYRRGTLRVDSALMRALDMVAACRGTARSLRQDGEDAGAAAFDGSALGHAFRAAELRYDALGGLTAEQARRRFLPGARWTLYGEPLDVVAHDENGIRLDHPTSPDGVWSLMSLMTRAQGWRLVALAPAPDDRP